MRGYGCSSEMINRHLASAVGAINEPGSVFHQFNEKLQAAMQSQAVLCEPRDAQQMRAEIENRARIAFGGTDARLIRKCGYPDAATAMERLKQAEKNSVSLSSIEAEALKAGKLLGACKQKKAARQLATLTTKSSALHALETISLSGTRLMINRLRAKLLRQSVSCGAKSSGYALVTVSGAGFIPHWAGASHPTSGSSAHIIKIDKSTTLGAIARELYKKYADVNCKSALPRGILNYNFPDIKQTLQVDVRELSEEEFKKRPTFDKWKKKTNVRGPSLSELRGAACP